MKLHMFICTNVKEKQPGTDMEPRYCDGTDLYDQIKKYIKELKKQNILNAEQVQQIRINKSGCLGQCSKGPAVLNYVSNDTESFKRELILDSNIKNLKSVLNKHLAESFNISI